MLLSRGYNQEDSIIMNRARSTWSVSTHFHTIIEDENDDEENGFSEYFSIDDP
jgi:DNA-directed RNA polymerase beta subunit